MRPLPLLLAAWLLPLAHATPAADPPLPQLRAYETVTGATLVSNAESAWLLGHGGFTHHPLTRAVTRRQHAGKAQRDFDAELKKQHEAAR